MPLTSPVHPPSDSAVYFPSGKPGVSLSPSPACPPDARSKMTGTDWFTEELAVRPPFSLTCNPHPGEAGCLQQASKLRTQPAGERTAGAGQGRLPAWACPPQSQAGSAEPRRCFLSGEATQWDPGPTGEAEADGRPTGHTGGLFTNHLVVVLTSFSP